ncbi:competence protein ComK [Metabacillus sp. RGM 3146]|uniref:competence protein ComK n=1 Tax=Metabacillus sp. RGM 3146 TaxID=3401092 RepID=UPI003B9D562F
MNNDDRFYLISSHTKYLAPVYNEYGELCTIAYELYRTVHVRKSPTKIIHENCLHFGSSYKGRLKAANDILPGQKMLPVCVSELTGLFFIPTVSPDSDECVWIGYKNVKIVIPYNEKSVVLFSDGSRLFVPMHRDILQGKFGKASHLLVTFLERQKRIQEDVIQWHIDHKERTNLLNQNPGPDITT